MAEIKFKAAVLEELRQPFVVRELEVPKYLSVGQVLVKIHFSGICGSQLGEQNGVKGPDKYLPHCLGHEGSGTVIACGPGVKNVKPQDHVVLHWRKGTGIECEPPKYWCPNTGTEIGGGWVTTFQEYSVVSENRLTKIPDDVPLDEAALLGCAISTGLGIIFNELHVKAGQSILIIGCGGVGLNVIQGAMLANAYPIIGVDIREEKCMNAFAAGATHTVIMTQEPVEDIFNRKHADYIWQKGADIVVETSGQQNMMEIGWQLTSANGVLCLVAQLSAEKKMSFNPLAMHGGKRIIGSDGGATNPTEDIPRYIKLLKAGRLDLKSLITHVVELDDINDIFAEIRKSRVGRALIKLQP